MAHVITAYCPNCRRVLRKSNAQWGNYGPPVVKCGTCGVLINTGLHREPTWGDKFIAVAPLVISIPFSIWLYFLFGKGFMIFMVFYTVGMTTWMSYGPIKALWDYQKNKKKSNSQQTPIW